MNAEFAYYTEINGKISFLRDGGKTDDIGYFVRLRLDHVKGSLVIPVPEKIEGKPVTMIGIIPVLPEGCPVPELPSPLIRHISIPSGVRHIRIGISIKRNSATPKDTDGEKLNPLNGSAVEISPDNPYFCTFGQGIYSADMTRLYHIFSPGETFSVPYGVRKINSGAGCAVNGIKKLFIPESVIEIGNCAFERCADLEEVEIGAKKLGRRAFYGCERLVSLSVKGLDSFMGDAFEGCGGPGGVLKDAFGVCYNLRKFKCVTDKSTGSFELSLDCEVIIQPEGGQAENAHIIYGNSPFLKNERLKRLTLSNVESVCYGAFAECENLGELIVEKAGRIGMFAFMSCHSLLSAYLDCKELYESALNSCTSLENVTLLNTEIIRGGAFSHCKGLKEIKLPDTLTEIGNNAFYKTNIGRLTIPPSVKKLGKEILSGGVLEIVSENGALALPTEDILSAGSPGVTLEVRRGETGDVLYKLDLSYDFTEIFTEFGIDVEAYEKSRDELSGHFAALISARCSPQGIPDPDSGEFEPFRRYVSCLSAFNILEMIDEADSEGVFEYSFFDEIDDNCFLSLADYSAKRGTTEITALLMQRIHERRRGNNE